MIVLVRLFFLSAHFFPQYDYSSPNQITHWLANFFTATFSDVNDDAKEEMEKDFTKNFDKDNNSKLDKEEMKSWLFPDDDFSTEEPKALIKEADDDKDGKLSMDEIMKNYKVFIEDEPEDSNHDEL